MGAKPPQKENPRAGGWARAAQRARPGWGCGGRSPPQALAPWRAAPAPPHPLPLSRKGRGGRPREHVAPSKPPGGGVGAQPPHEESPRVGGWARAAQRARPGWGCGGRSPPQAAGRGARGCEAPAFGARWWWTCGNRTPRPRMRSPRRRTSGRPTPEAPRQPPGRFTVTDAPPSARRRRRTAPHPHPRPLPLTPSLSRKGRGGRTGLGGWGCDPAAAQPGAPGGGVGAASLRTRGNLAGPPHERSPRAGGWARAAQRARPGWGCGGRSPPREGARSATDQRRGARSPRSPR